MKEQADQKARFRKKIQNYETKLEAIQQGADSKEENLEELKTRAKEFEELVNVKVCIIIIIIIIFILYYYYFVERNNFFLIYVICH